MKHEKKRPASLSAKVLLVDDDQRLLAALSTRLTQMGCRCTTCTNASEAMTRFAAGGFDLVITDLSMPGVDGLSILGLIRSQSDIPIIVVTGHSDEYEKWTRVSRNVTVIRKPFETGALLKCVRSLLIAPNDPEVRLKAG